MKFFASQKMQISLIYVFLATSTLVAFWQVNKCEFVNFDDPDYVTKNIHIQNGLTIEGIRWAFTTLSDDSGSHASFWHPLTWLSLMFDNQIYGLKPGGFHLTNLILHLLNALLLFWLFNRMTGYVWRSAFIAALFALHPLHVESVAWVTERKDTLSALFFMLTLCAYVYFVEKPAAYRYVLCLICFALGLMAKPMVVTLPFVLLLLDYWPLERFQPWKTLPNPSPIYPATNNKKGVKRKVSKKAGKEKITPSSNLQPSKRKPSETRQFRLLIEKTPFLVLAVIFSAIAYYAQHTLSYVTFPLISRMANSIVSYTVYLKKTLWPYDLAVFYPFPQKILAWQVVGAASLLLTFSAAVIYAVKRLPYLFVGWFWYIGTLLPVIGIIQVGNHALADRYTYIPLIGLFIMVAWGGPNVLNKLRYRQEILIASSAFILAFSSIVTWTQVGYWKNSFTLFDHALKVTNNNDLAHNNVGIALRSIGSISEADLHYREALKINPQNEQAHFNLGNLLLSNGKTEEAIDHYEEALRIKPNYGNAHVNLGNAFMSQNRYQDAIDHFKEAIASGYASATVYYNVGEALLALGKPDEATAQFKKAISILPDFAEAYNELGRIVATEGKVEEAIGYFKEAIRLKPDLASAQTNLKMALSIKKTEIKWY